MTCLNRKVEEEGDACAGEREGVCVKPPEKVDEAVVVQLA